MFCVRLVYVRVLYSFHAEMEMNVDVRDVTFPDLLMFPVSAELNIRNHSVLER